MKPEDFRFECDSILELALELTLQQAESFYSVV